MGVGETGEVEEVREVREVEEGKKDKKNNVFGEEIQRFGCMAKGK